MYFDPSGEVAWIVVGAVAGAYFTGVKANGSWNPAKWNWGATWGKIAMGGAIGAFTGVVGGAVGVSAAAYAATTWGINGGLLGGAIAGASGGAVAGAINGFATSVMFGENVIEGTLMGGLSEAAIGGVVGGVSGAIGQVVKNAQAAKIGAPQGTILKGAPIVEGRSAWTLNNTAKIVTKTTTVGTTPPSQGKVIIGEVHEQRVVGYKIDPITEQFEPITVDIPNTAAQSSDQLYEIADGVRRSKVLEKLGHETIDAIDNAGNTFKVPIKNLRSPMKSSISNDIRYKNVFNSIQSQGQNFPIYVQPGNRGIPVSEIKLTP